MEELALKFINQCEVNNLEDVTDIKRYPIQCLLSKSFFKVLSSIYYNMSVTDNHNHISFLFIYYLI